MRKHSWKKAPSLWTPVNTRGQEQMKTKMRTGALRLVTVINMLVNAIIPDGLYGLSITDLLQPLKQMPFVLSPCDYTATFNFFATKVVSTNLSYKSVFLDQRFSFGC